MHNFQMLILFLSVTLAVAVKGDDDASVTEKSQNPRILDPIPSLFSLNTCQYLRNISGKV